MGKITFAAKIAHDSKADCFAFNITRQMQGLQIGELSAAFLRLLQIDAHYRGYGRD